MATTTQRLSLLLRAFVDQDEVDACEHLDALREDVAERGRFPDVTRALKAFKVENDRDALESSGDIDDDVESDAPYVDDPDAADADS